MKINIIINKVYFHINALLNHVYSFQKYSKHQINYIDITEHNKLLLNNPDVIILHYSVIHDIVIKRRYNMFTDRYVTILENYSGIKAVFIQDEYDRTNLIKAFLKNIGINIIFTCLSEKNAPIIYNNLTNVKFVNVLTGYVSEDVTWDNNIAWIPSKKEIINSTENKVLHNGLVVGKVYNLTIKAIISSDASPKWHGAAKPLINGLGEPIELDIELEQTAKGYRIPVNRTFNIKKTITAIASDTTLTINTVNSPFYFMYDSLFIEVRSDEENNVSKISNKTNPKNIIKNKLIQERSCDVFYSGRNLNYRYGDLGQDKYNIGVKMKQFCQKYNLMHNIEWTESGRIYGEAWLKTLENSKTTLATETGCNVFDFDGNIRLGIDAKLRKNHGYTYEQAKLDFNLQNCPILCTGVSPKMFEAATVGTVLVMFEGEYLGIFKSNRHYIPLKKDFSNIEDVMSKIKNDDYLQQMANTTYTEIVASGKYSYKNFVEMVDNILLSYKYDISYNLSSSPTNVETYWSSHTVSDKITIINETDSKKYINTIKELYPLHMDLFHLYDKHDNEVILDYGCGTGNDLIGYKLYSNAKSIIGVDISLKALSMARKRLNLHNNLSEIKLIKIDDGKCKIPLSNNYVDYAQSSGVIHHVTNPKDVLHEIYRVLKPGGLFRVMVYHKNSLFINLVIPYYYQRQQHRYTTNKDAYEIFDQIADGGAPIAKLYTGDEFVSLATECGFNAKFIDAAYAKIELTTFKLINKALEHQTMPNIHKEFLKKVKNMNGYPRYNNEYNTGMNAIFELEKPYK